MLHRFFLISHRRFVFVKFKNAVDSKIECNKMWIGPNIKCDFFLENNCERGAGWRTLLKLTIYCWSVDRSIFRRNRNPNFLLFVSGGEHRRNNVYVQRICKCWKVIVRSFWIKGVYIRWKIWWIISNFLWLRICGQLAFAEKAFLNIYHALCSKRAANI